ncbi:hypothetical protein NL676_030917 [Syzygium grande]|nr:hypothetical protein NL676_030917 [Syzygium grande]
MGRTAVLTDEQDQEMNEGRNGGQRGSGASNDSDEAGRPERKKTVLGNKESSKHDPSSWKSPPHQTRETERRAGEEPMRVSIWRKEVKVGPGTRLGATGRGRGGAGDSSYEMAARAQQRAASGRE